jgi:hypothetical protein
MDALLLGVGIGFDTKGAGKVVIKQPQTSNAVYPFLIVEMDGNKSTWKVLDGFFKGEPIPKMDYSLIRTSRLPIKGFWRCCFRTRTFKGND